MGVLRFREAFAAKSDVHLEWRAGGERNEEARIEPDLIVLLADGNDGVDGPLRGRRIVAAAHVDFFNKKTGDAEIGDPDLKVGLLVEHEAEVNEDAFLACDLFVKDLQVGVIENHVPIRGVKKQDRGDGDGHGGIGEFQCRENKKYRGGKPDEEKTLAIAAERRVLRAHGEEG